MTTHDTIHPVVEHTPAEGDFDLMVGDLLQLATVMGCEAPQNHYEGVRHG